MLRASAENHGGLSTSLTAPNPKAQAHLIVETQRLAGIDPRTIGFIECHGTGTPLGDPIEINGLKMAFTEHLQHLGVAFNGQAFCGLGSVKSNIGHAETAAGIAGVIKTLLSLQHKTLISKLTL
ncbi:polyketide synthase [Methylocucumis oryzae]|uniref:polyketide synthase n=1 Tax=Methylocucumis oryzae TaxID=1632867 RepID=UPI001EF9F582|nr:polyketide synthase [Methylocucumis oryzae]